MFISGIMRKEDEFERIERIAHQIKRSAAKRFFKDLAELKKSRVQK